MQYAEQESCARKLYLLVAKKDGRYRTASAQASIHEQAVEYLKKKKGTQQQASEIFGLSRSGIEKIWRKYKTEGKRGISEKKRGVQGGKKVNGKQSAEVGQLIKDKLPDQSKLSFGLWTREAVQQLMLNRYGIELSRWQVGRYLKRWGYTPQKPIARAFEQNPGKVKEWLEKEYPAIKKRAAKENSVIYFGDETKRGSDHQAGAMPRRVKHLL
jgi:transposase